MIGKTSKSINIIFYQPKKYNKILALAYFLLATVKCVMNIHPKDQLSKIRSVIHACLNEMCVWAFMRTIASHSWPKLNTSDLTNIKNVNK